MANKEVKAFREFADRQEPKVARALLDGFNQLRNQLTLRQLSEYIERGDVAGLLELLNQDNIANAMTGFGIALASVSFGGAQLTADLQPPVRGPGNTMVNITFNVANPKLAEVAQTQTATRIREVGNDVRAVVRQIVQDGSIAGENPITIARRVKESVGLTAKQELAVRNYRADLERGSASALNRELRDRRFDPTVRRAKDKPLSQRQVDRMVERYRDRYIKYRSQTIARTETIRALQAAQHELLNQYVREGKLDARQIRRFWIFSQDDRTRHAHREIPGMNDRGVGLNEPFQTPLGPLLYPAAANGLPENVINCRCTVFPRILSMELVSRGS